MSLQDKFKKYPNLFKWTASLGFPLTSMLLCFSAATAFGQDGTQAVTPEMGPANIIPIVSTNGLAGLAFYWIMGFLQKTIDRYEEKIEKMEAAHYRDEDIIRRERDTWAARYEKSANDSLEDARSLRLPSPKPSKL